MMLIVYLVTLNHWVTLLNLGQVATVSGWMWQPQIQSPLIFLITLPIRLLPAAAVPVVLNVFSALCAAATLAVLARSVAILPHDRTDMERQRERSDFSFLTGWVAWVPPVVAVIFAGAQLGFWENATSFSGESFELLWFAVILWQLLEYRLDEAEGRLYVAALLYGLGLTENWALLGFFPLFITMIIWLRGFDFFNIHFLGRMILCGVGGLLLLFLLPALARISTGYPGVFWESMKANLRVDWQVIRVFFNQSDVRHNLGLISLTSLLPAFVMAIRWSATFGDSSRVGTAFVNYVLHTVNAILLAVLAWVTFDPPFSPQKLAQELGFNVPALTFYYIVAICIGYYSGYCLLVFGVRARPTRRNNRPDPALPKSVMWLCPFIVFGTLAALALLAVLLVYKNGPVIRTVNDNSLAKFGRFSTQNLPPNGAILLCDSDDPNGDQPVRAFLVQAALAREGISQKYPVIDTQALNWAPYHRYLHRRYPAVWPQSTTTNEVAGIPPWRIFVLLNQLSKSNTLCYLNPSFGYYFEQFYQEPHGLVYSLKLMPDEMVLPPPMSAEALAENDAFWRQVLDTARASVAQAMHPWNPATAPGFLGWLMTNLRVPAESNPNALAAGAYYSRGLNYFAVQLQRAGKLESAAGYFTDACELNSNNVVAARNLAFNKTLRAGSPPGVDPGRVTPDQFGKYRNWNEVLTANGPFDETSFCFAYGDWLMSAQPRMMRQAAASFDRVRQLAPDNLAARLFLAEIYILYRQPDKAMDVLHDPLTRPARFALTEFNSTPLNVLAAAAHFQKGQNEEGVALLESEMSRHPDDETLLLVSAQVFNMRGLHTNALRAINRKLARSPDDPTWLYGKGIVSLQVGAYGDAIAALSKFLDTATNNPDALYNRGFAYYQSDQLDAARTDFLHLQKTYTNNFQVAYGLGEIARREHQTNEAIRNYRIYLANAPTNSAELKTVRAKLSELGVK